MKTFTPTKERTELLDSMVESFVCDVEYQFDLGDENQAVTIILESLSREYTGAVKRQLEKLIYAQNN